MPSPQACSENVQRNLPRGAHQNVTPSDLWSNTPSNGGGGKQNVQTIHPRAAKPAKPAEAGEAADMLDCIDEDRERAIVGALIVDGALAHGQCLRLRPEMFAIRDYQILFRCATELLLTRDVIDNRMLADVLRQRGEFAQLSNGDTTILETMEGLFPRMSLDHHVDRIVRLWKARSGLRSCHEFASAMAASQDVDEALVRLHARSLDLATGEVQLDPSVRTIVHTMNKWHAGETGAGIPYGLGVLDNLTGGMFPGEVTVVGARNGVGKTSFVVQMLVACGRAGIPVDFFSLEESKENIELHLAAVEGDIDYRKMRFPQLATPADKKAGIQAGMRIGEWPLRIFEDSDQNVHQIVAQARHGVRKLGVRVVIVDYIQSVQAEGKDERLRVANASKALTAFAKSTGAHVILVSQVRKVPPELYVHPPTLADLRESSGPADNAHCVLLLHRMYDNKRVLQPKTEISIPKQRRGQTRSLPAMFDTRLCIFRNMRLDEMEEDSELAS